MHALTMGPRKFLKFALLIFNLKVVLMKNYEAVKLMVGG